MRRLFHSTLAAPPPLATPRWKRLSGWRKTSVYALFILKHDFSLHISTIVSLSLSHCFQVQNLLLSCVCYSRQSMMIGVAWLAVGLPLSLFVVVVAPRRLLVACASSSAISCCSVNTVFGRGSGLTF